MPRVRINRGERRTPFLSNLTKPGPQKQVTPNGCAYDGPWPEFGVAGDTLVGAESAPVPPAVGWPSGNRSGE